MCLKVCHGGALGRRQAHALLVYSVDQARRGRSERCARYAICARAGGGRSGQTGQGLADDLTHEI